MIFVGELEHDKCRSFLGAVSAIQNNVIESAGGELLIGHGRSAQQALDAAQFHSEDMDDETANVFGTCDVDLDIQRIAVLLKELAPAAGLSVVVVASIPES